MAKRTIYVSDKSGTPIEEGQGAKVTIKFNDARRGIRELDVTNTEAEELGDGGRTVARRGRKPASTSS